jgi:hypothetical protein
MSAWKKALQAFESTSGRLFETATDGIPNLGAETGTLADVNPFLVESLGFSQQVFPGEKVRDLGLLRDIAANAAKFSEFLADENQTQT